MLENLSIWIPSRERSHVIKEGTLTQLPTDLLKRTFIVVGESELATYRPLLEPTIRIIVLATPVEGIPKVRQWIMERANTAYVMFLSDDLQFSYRNEEGKLKSCEPDDVSHMVKTLYRWLKQGYVHVGVSQRAFNHTSTNEYEEITRMNDVYAYNREKVLASGIRFDDVFGMEDFHMTLSLLHQGYPNIVSYKYAWSQRKSGESGGCSLYRTWETQKKDAFKLLQLHPGCVQILNKESKVEWEGVGKNRVDVDIMWKKAFQPRRQEPARFNWGKK